MLFWPAALQPVYFYTGSMQLNEIYDRSAMLIGEDGVEKLAQSHVAVFGLGGVGSWAAESLARAGTGTFSLVDSDTVAPSNVNRQLVAALDTVGERKTDVMERRIRSINEAAVIHSYPMFYAPETAEEINWEGVSYIVDAIDTVTGKLALIEEAQHRGIPIISCMGTGNKLDPTQIRIGDIYETSVDPLARVMRRELRRRGIEKLKVVYSLEEPIKPQTVPQDAPPGRHPPGSMPFVPPSAGLAAASEVVCDLLKR